MRVSVRSWLIRGLILAGVAALAALGWVANSWVSPERVRENVLAHLHEQFDGVDVSVGSARMRILGGIAVTDLRVVRRGSPDQPILIVPSAVLYHDKEQLNRGRLVIRKVELENPEVHLERSADGRWNLAEVLRPGPADRPVPTFVVKGATIHVIDHMPNSLPPLTLADAQITLLNDPLPVLTIQASANAHGFGPVQVRGRINRVSKHTSLGIELAAFPLGEVAPTAAERFAPALVPYLGKLTATASVQADLTYTPETTPAWRHDVRVEVKDGRLEHPDLPRPVEKIAVKLRSVDGRVKVEEAAAKIGPATVKLSLETRADLASGGRKPPVDGVKEESKETGGLRPPLAKSEDDLLARVEDHLQRLDLTVSGVPLDDALFTRLGERGARARRMFAPVGVADFAYKFAREAAGWKREFEVRPRGVALVYEKFKYPVGDVEGTVRRVVTHAGIPDVRIDLRGKAAGESVTLTGQVHGDGPDPAVNLRIVGNNLPIDEKLIAAFPGRYPELIRQFRASGRADFVAEIVQKPGVNLSENEFRVDLREAAFSYKLFPYRLEKVKGTVVVKTTSAEPRPGEPSLERPERDDIVLHKFVGVHGGGTVWLDGSKQQVPGSRDRKLVLRVGGNGCGLDDDLRKALAELKMEGAWNTFSPRGNLAFQADLEILDRAAPPGRPDLDPPFDAASDLKLTFNFSGPTVTPSFFRYEMTDLSGWLEYKNGRVDLAHFAGRHGDTRLKLAAGEVRFYPDGAVWANVGGLECKPFLVDSALVKALPGKLRSAVDDLKLRGSADLTVKHLVVLTPPDPPAGGAIPPPEPLPIGPAVDAGRAIGAGRAGGVSPLLTPSNSGLTPTARPFLARGQSPTPAAMAGPVLPIITPDPVVYWDAEVKLAGASLDTGIPWEDVFGGVACRGRYEGTHMGMVRGNVWLDRATLARQPVTATKAHVSADPQLPDPLRPGQFLPIEMKFADIAGSLFHGTVGGEARVVLGDPVRYELWLTAADVQLDEVARHYKLGSDADLKGVAQAQLRLYSRPDPKTGQPLTEGAGKIDMPTGRMYNLPVLLDLVKVLKLQAPDKTAFEEAHVVFRIAGDRIKVDQLDLIGKAVCLGGSGELDASGEYVKFEFYTMWSQLLKQMINTPLGDLSAFLSKNLFKIKLTRENGELRYRPEPVPVVTEPAKAVADRLKSRAAKMTGK